MAQARNRVFVIGVGMTKVNLIVLFYRYGRAANANQTEYNFKRISG